MEFRKIIYFLKVAENRSFRKAAQQLYISPQSLSRSIQELEQALGYPLLIRTTARVDLTDKGKAVYGRFAGLRDAWEKAWQDSVEDRNVRFAFFAGLPQNGVLGELIHAMTQQHPDWNVELFAMDTPKIRRGIESGDLDLAMTVFHEGEFYPDFQMIPIIKADAWVWMPEDHPLAEKEEITLGDLYQTRVLFAKDEPVNEGSIIYKIREHGQVVYVNENLTLHRSIQAHKGVSILPPEGKEKYTGIVCRPLAESDRFYFAICLFFKKTHWMAPQFAALLPQGRLST